MANIHNNSETSTHQEPFSVKIVDVLALFCIFSAFLPIGKMMENNLVDSEIVLIFAPYLY